MYLVAIAWMYVVVMMAVAEAISPQGTVLGALITLVFYGLLPISIILYIMGTPSRRRARMKAEAEAEVQASAAAPDGSSHPTGDAVAPEGKQV
jgi:hypothetical protein